MRIIIAVFFLTFSINAQEFLQAKIVKKDNDTIYTKIQIPFNPTNPKLFTFNTLNEKIKINVSDIKELTITDLSSNSQLFIAEGKFLSKIIFKGNIIKWYRTYVRNAYDGSIMENDYMVNENNEKFKFGLFNNKREKLKEITFLHSTPELIKLIENMKMTDENILMILKKYEE